MRQGAGSLDVAYPLVDGRHDVHKALVMAGAEPLSGKIAAHAYTDGGLVVSMPLRIEKPGSNLKISHQDM